MICIPLVVHKPFPDGRWRQLLHSYVKLLIKLRGKYFHTVTGSHSVPLCRHPVAQISSCLQWLTPVTGSVEALTRAGRRCLCTSCDHLVAGEDGPARWRNAVGGVGWRWRFHMCGHYVATKLGAAVSLPLLIPVPSDASGIHSNWVSKSSAH